MQAFLKKYLNYKLVHAIDNKKGSWINNWSKVIRIFEVTICWFVLLP
jgi:hypothetical protein